MTNPTGKVDGVVRNAVAFALVLVDCIQNPTEGAQQPDPLVAKKHVSIGGRSGGGSGNGSRGGISGGGVTGGALKGSMASAL